MALQRRAPAVDLVLDLLVPLASGVFTTLVIFVPALAILMAMYAGPQRQWLLAYLDGLLRSSAADRVVA